MYTVKFLWTAFVVDCHIMLNRPIKPKNQVNQLKSPVETEYNSSSLHDLCIFANMHGMSTVYK